MLYRLLIALLLAHVLVGCVSTSTQHSPFTGDWADHQRRNPGFDRRGGDSGKSAEERRLGPATVTHDEGGRPQVNIGGTEGLGADVDFRTGGSGRIRYRRHWNFVRPERRR